MANRYATGDWRNPTAGVPADVQQFATWTQGNPQIQAILANPAYAGNSPAQRRARQAAIHQVVVQAGQHIPKGLKINADGRLETDDQTGMPGWAKALIIGGGAAGAIFGIPALAGVLGGGAGGAGAAGAGTAGALGPSTAASMAETAAIAGGSTVPASLAALTPAELAAAGGAAGAGAAGAIGTSGAETAAGTGAAALGPSTPESIAATQAVTQGSTVPASLTSAGVPTSSTLSGVGGFLSRNPYVLPTAIGVGGQLGAAAIQSSGLSKAAEIQAQVQREAIAYEKQRDQYLSQLEQGRYADANTRFAPYLGLGQSAAERLGGILGLSTAGPTLSTPPTVPGTAPVQTGVRPGLDTSGPPIGTAVPRGTSSGASYLMPQTAQVGTVAMRGPDGSMRQIPLNQVAHYTALGAVQV